ncbi:MAG: desulfoferrodoxin [Defluviitaleaceae bacterium]|nr:desulfoferrodoxin [Defluviitaleaceae bacterium]
MCSKQKFFLCKVCGNMIGRLNDKGSGISCCGEPMSEIIANTAEASTEKHLPVIDCEECCCGDDDCGCEDEACSCGGGGCIRLCVSVGAAPHPMDESHRIMFVYVETERGGQRKCLCASETPKTCFCLNNDKPIAVYAYCNLHGLWRTDCK